MPRSPLTYGSRLVLQDVLLLMTIIFLGAALFWGYWFFFYHDPVRDARTSINLLCDCAAQNSKRKVEKYKEFLSAFDSYHFKRQRQARDTLQQLLGADDDLQPCATAADSKRLMLRAYYVATPEKQYQFD